MKRNILKICAVCFLILILWCTFTKFYNFFMKELTKLFNQDVAIQLIGLLFIILVFISGILFFSLIHRQDKRKNVFEYGKVVEEKKNRIQSLKEEINTAKICLSEVIDVLKILQQQREYQQTQYWGHYIKLFAINLILIALPHFINKDIVTDSFLHYSPLIPIILSTFAIFGLKGELARLHYTMLRVFVIEESLSEAFNEDDKKVDIFTNFSLLRNTNRWYAENYGLILFVLIALCGVVELILYDWIWK
ncbi:MAG: hypothetical protein LBU13_02470 [Synergistaceae bacterium]|nr:hypothetical protein [Synergistaceae bacterium]